MVSSVLVWEGDSSPMADLTLLTARPVRVVLAWISPSVHESSVLPDSPECGECGNVPREGSERRGEEMERAAETLACVHGAQRSRHTHVQVFVLTVL